VFRSSRVKTRRRAIESFRGSPQAILLFSFVGSYFYSSITLFLYFLDLIFYVSLFELWWWGGGGLYSVFFLILIFFIVPVYRGSYNFLIYFHFPILEALLTVSLVSIIGCR
jgi:hypothetical protein